MLVQGPQRWQGMVLLGPGFALISCMALGMFPRHVVAPLPPLQQRNITHHQCTAKPRRLLFLPLLQCPVAVKRGRRWGRRDAVGWVDTGGVPVLAQLHVAAFCLLDLLQTASCSDLCCSLKIGARGESGIFFFLNWLWLNFFPE